MSRAERLAVVATHLRPAQGFGGPAESTGVLIKTWRSQGRDLLPVCSDGTRGVPLSAADFERALDGPVETYRARGAVRWGFGLGAPFAVAAVLRRADRAYISGIATWPTTWAGWLARLMRRPYAVALRGGLMQEHWLSIRTAKPLKAVFYRVLVFPVIRAAAAVHVTSALEASHAAAVLPSAKLVVIPNLVSGGSGSAAPAPAGGAGLKLLYLGRLSPEKGILGFARRFLEARSADDELRIAGAPEGAYGGEVVDLCAREPSLTYLGQLDRAGVAEALRSVHAVVLPSGMDGDTRENFGNVVVEALQEGRAAMTTRNLAWDDLDQWGAGVTFARDGSDVAEALGRLRALTRSEALAERCQAVVRERFAPDVVADRLWREIFTG